VTERLTFTEITKLLDEFAGNEVALHILGAQDSYSVGLSVTLKKLSRRQDEIQKLILVACGLDWEEAKGE
jgi:hypothetical protein